MTINLSNIVSVGGKTVASGIASGFDSSKLIEELAKAKRTPAVALEKTIETNGKKVSAFNDLRGILEKLNTAVNYMRNVPGVANASENIFQYRSSSVSSNSGIAASNYLTASIAPGTELSNYNVQISQVARQRITQSQSFISNTSSVTEAGGGATAGLFSAGTFEIAKAGPTAIAIDTKTTGSLTAGQVSVQGGLVGGLLSTGISNIQITGTGDFGFYGDITSFNGTYNSSAGTLTLTTTINGKVYTSNAVTANSAIGADTGILSGSTITFSNSSTGTAFDLVLGQNVVLNEDPDEVDNFEVNLASALSSQNIFQERQVTSFTDANVKAPLTGLTSANIRYNSYEYNSDGTNGTIGGFTVTADSGGGNGSISVNIDGELFTVSSLTAAEGDNLTLTASSGKTFKINLNDAGVTLDLSTQVSADSIATALNYAFGSQGITSVTLEQGDSLLDIVGKFNAVKDQSGVSATIVQVAENDYRLSLQATQPGINNSFTFFDSTGALSQVTFNDVSTAQDAIFSVNGIEVTRSTNAVNDVIDGVTFNLLQATPDYGLVTATELSLTVQADTTTVENAVVNLINAYNDFRIFVAKQTATNDDGTLSEDALLASDNTFRDLITQLENQVTSLVSGADNSNYNALGALGITLVDYPGDDETPATKNTLTYDPQKLKDLLATNFTAVRQMFEYSFSASSADLLLAGYSNKTTLTDYKLDIDIGRAAGQQVAVRDLDNNLLFYAGVTPINGGGYTITGLADTTLEGLKLIYGGDGTDTITVNSSKGIAASLYDFTSQAVELNGTIDSAIQSVQDEDDRHKTEVTRIDELVDRYRQTLLSQYSSLESKIAVVNSTLQFLDAQAKSIFGDN